VLLALLLSACPGSLPPENTKPVVTIIGAKLIDGSGGDPIEDSVIVIDGTRIRTAGPRSHTPVPKGGEIVDGVGKTVIPGLVDAHVHYFRGRAEMERALRAQLYFGVTTVRSCGEDTSGQLAVLEDLKAGRIPGPRVYTAGPEFPHPKDQPIEEPLPGWATHDEMALMVEAGQSPLEAIRAATRERAESVGGGGAEFGTLEAGKIADLILLEADPLEDIANTKKISRVMQAGKWLDRQALSQ
jgi:imidazolonepropionase-like amidohydrolase